MPAAPFDRFPAGRDPTPFYRYDDRVLTTVPDATLETDPAIAP